MTRMLFAFIAAATMLAACGTPPADLDRALARHSAHDLYQVTLVPPAPAPGINRMHAWQVKLATADGTPVHGAQFGVDGGMPQHGHGLPTKPRVTRELADGSYLLEGMKFSMPGWWELKLEIASTAGTDRVTFNTVLDAAGALQ